MRTLLIIESPGKRKKIEEILGQDYVVRASFGHIRDLPRKEIGVEAPNYEPRYVIEEPRAKETVAALKKAVKEVDRVLLATDRDREGEAIAWHLAEVLRLKNPQRVAYGEITQAAITAAVASPRPLDMRLVDAQKARRVLDRLVGWQVSPSLRQTTGEDLSAGRVQSPAVRLVVDRERAIRAFAPTQHFLAQLSFGPPATWTATWITEPHLVQGSEYLLDQGLAEAAAGVRLVRVRDFAVTQTTAAPKPPFTTSTLQQSAQVALKLKPKRTMEIAQSLYELGAITYMRTDSPNLAEEAYEQISRYAAANSLPMSKSRRTWKAKGVAQEGHECIRPTHFDELVAGKDDDERALYALIWARAVASQLEDATYSVRTATLEGAHLLPDGRHPTYMARSRTLVRKGWKALHDESDDADTSSDGDDDGNPVPMLDIGTELNAADGAILTKTTVAPARYKLSTLIKALEANGIGRPSTYAAILDTITQRGYILENAKGFLTPTPKGETIVDALVGAFDFIELDYTRALEDELDEVARGAKTYHQVVAGAGATLAGQLAQRPMPAAYSCPECGRPMQRRSGRHGIFWGCSGYHDGCKTSLPDVDGKPGERATRPAAASSPEPVHVCPKCSSPLRRWKKSKAEDPKKKGYDFWGCTNRGACNSTFNTGDAGGPIFP